MSLTPRQRLTQRLNQLTQVDLPKVANERGYPVRLDHCFKRIVMDAACGQRWDKNIARPFYRHAPLLYLMTAVAIAQGMMDDPGLDVHTLNNRSLAYRGKKPKPLAST